MLTSRRLPLFLLALSCSACDGDSALHRLAIPEHEALAKAFLDSARAGNIDYAIRVAGPSSQQMPGVRDSLRSALSKLPGGAIDTIRLIGVNRRSQSGVTTSDLTYEIYTPQGWGLCVIRVNEELNLRFVDGFTGQPLAGSLEELNSFRRGRGGLVPWSVLFAAILCVAFSIVTAVRMVRSNLPKRGWWALLSLVGGGGLLVDWTSGEIGLRLFLVQLLSASFVRAGPAAPWILSVSVPFGAILAWIELRSYASVPASPALPSPSSLAP